MILFVIVLSQIKGISVTSMIRPQQHEMKGSSTIFPCVYQTAVYLHWLNLVLRKMWFQIFMIKFTKYEKISFSSFHLLIINDLILQIEWKWDAGNTIVTETCIWRRDSEWTNNGMMYCVFTSHQSLLLNKTKGDKKDYYHRWRSHCSSIKIYCTKKVRKKNK